MHLLNRQCNKTECKPSPIFIVGSPRSGTTMIGNFIGSSSAVCNLEEFGGFYLTRFLIENLLMKKMPSPFKDAYVTELRKHATGFATRKAKSAKCKYFLDATPGNLLIAKTLSDEFPDAIFVLMLRHYSGVVLSLNRSFKEGYLWAGRTWEHRAELWRTFYSNVICLPQKNTIVVGYDLLCSNPKKYVKKLISDLASYGVDNTVFNMAELAKNHAPNINEERQTIGVAHSKGRISLRSIKSYDDSLWSIEIHDRIRPKVSGVDALLSELYGKSYISPLPLSQS